MNSLSFRKFTLNSLTFSHLSVFPIFLTNSLKVHYCFREFTLNRSAISLWIYCPSLFLYDLTMNPLSVTQLHYKFTVFIAIWRWIHFLFANSLLIDIEFTISSRIHYLFRELTINSLSFREFSMIWLWIHYLFANSLWFDYEFTIFWRIHSDLTMNPLSFSRFDYEFTFFS